MPLLPRPAGTTGRSNLRDDESLARWRGKIGGEIPRQKDTKTDRNEPRPAPPRERYVLFRWAIKSPEPISARGFHECSVRCWGGAVHKAWPRCGPCCSDARAAEPMAEPMAEPDRRRRRRSSRTAVAQVPAIAAALAALAAPAAATSRRFSASSSRPWLGPPSSQKAERSPHGRPALPPKGVRLPRYGVAAPEQAGRAWDASSASLEHRHGKARPGSRASRASRAQPSPLRAATSNPAGPLSQPC